MVQLLLIGIGAGAAAALLFASVASGSLISVLLFYLAPLPILIAALGWSHWAALIAAILASAGLAVVFSTFFFFAFLFGIGLPAWWLGYLALLARPSTTATPDSRDWYPVGHLVVWAAIIGAIIVVAAILNFGTDEESFRAALRRGVDRMLNLPTRPPGAPAPGRVDASRLVDFLVMALPPAAAVLTTITNVLNLWLAGRIVTVSGRMRRPPSDLSAMRFPTHAPILVGAAIAGSFLPGLAGTCSGVLAASLLMAYAILGFAVLHSITRGLKSRMFVLGGIYAAVFVFGWPVLLVMLLGLADAALDIRGQVARKRGPPASPT
jgi:hypothetical protein